MYTLRIAVGNWISSEKVSHIPCVTYLNDGKWTGSRSCENSGHLPSFTCDGVTKVITWCNKKTQGLLACECGQRPTKVAGQVLIGASTAPDTEDIACAKWESFLIIEPAALVLLLLLCVSRLNCGPANRLSTLKWNLVLIIHLFQQNPLCGGARAIPLPFPGTFRHFGVSAVAYDNNVHVHRHDDRSSSRSI